MAHIAVETTSKGIVSQAFCICLFKRVGYSTNMKTNYIVDVNGEAIFVQADSPEIAAFQGAVISGFKGEVRVIVQDVNLDADAFRPELSGTVTLY